MCSIGQLISCDNLLENEIAQLFTCWDSRNVQPHDDSLESETSPESHPNNVSFESETSPESHPNNVSFESDLPLNVSDVASYDDSFASDTLHTV